MSLDKRCRLAILLGSCATCGGVALVISTPWGLGLSPDSAVYIGAARSLLRGNGFSLPTESGTFAPIAHYPPLYPVSLALLGLGGLDPVASAKWLNILLFCGNIFLSGVIAFVATASLRWSVITASLVATAFPVVLIHTMAWSEPLFLFCELCGILFLLVYFWRSGYRSLAIGGLAIGLSILARYAGLAVVAGGVVGILLVGGTRWKRKIVEAGIFLAISLLPTGLWFVRNRWVAGSATNREIGVHPIGFDSVGDVVSTIISWFSDFRHSSTQIQILAVCMTAVAILGLSLSNRYHPPQDKHVESHRPKDVSCLMALIVANYLLLLFASLSFLDIQTPIDTRILSPIYVNLVLLVVSLLIGLERRGRAGKSFRVILPTAALLVFGLQVPGTVYWLGQLYHNGVGYSSRGWRESELIKQLTSLDPSAAIFSNAPDVVYTLIGRPAAMIPRRVYPNTNRPNPDYESQIMEMRRSLKTKNGLLVYFYSVGWRWYLPSAIGLEKTLDLNPIIRTNDGVIYKIG